ncbi:MAG: hypothetical protein R3F43_31780 [bacterium]
MVTEIDEIVETDDAWYLDWRFAEDETPAAPADVRRWCETVHARGARCLFVGLPSDAPAALELFDRSGFRREGRLADFYEDGVHEERFRLDFP